MNTKKTKKTTRKSNPTHLELLHPSAQTAFVAGSFNDWVPEKTPMTSTGNGRWVSELAVAPGRYEYLFVVDGSWLPDPKAKEQVQ
ncbi:MAG TPA: glycogen-binding domain-containing protein, partial [Verrucomicrobiae bacterium]|nr:glycogen-binding domain-containing protein [Verrucomicrobiae bacterium]